ncbi:hypothetical protein [Rhodoplanes sp. SY1]|uniref:hypothetical protein n=1 Tax=Rhodoplanes sp. SY1 TaxID=3166646 RepID=UPI0038B582CA
MDANDNQILNFFRVADSQSEKSIHQLSLSFIVDPSKDITVAFINSGIAAALGAKVQITLDDQSLIEDGSADWFDSPLGYHSKSGGERIMKPVTGVRLAVYDGLWDFTVRQV